jgi:hypothetical protein
MCLVSPAMRRTIVIRAAFAPTRLSTELLQGAYEQVVPIRERVIEPAQAPSTDREANDTGTRTSSGRRVS